MTHWMNQVSKIRRRVRYHDYDESQTFSCCCRRRVSCSSRRWSSYRRVVYVTTKQKNQACYLSTIFRIRTTITLRWARLVLGWVTVCGRVHRLGL